MAETQTELAKRHCKACEPGTPALSREQVNALLGDVPGWELTSAQCGLEHFEKQIEKTYRFKNYYETMAFVNAVAWVSHREDHHPDLEVGYNRCKVQYSTHAVGGLSENDFICAAKVEMLMAQ
jgi:4a-hydroxytetrahydrobiopterin dehydratase